MTRRLFTVIFILAGLICAFTLSVHAQESGEAGGDEGGEMEWIDEGTGDLNQDLLANTVLVRARVLEILTEEEVTDEFTNEKVTNQTLRVLITSGEYKGKEITVLNHGVNNPVYNIQVGKGDGIIVALEIEDGEMVQAYVADYHREPQIYTLAVIFVLLLLAIGWRKGAKALCSLLITLLLIGWVLIPGLLRGYNPVVFTVIIAAVATAVTMLTVGGFTRKSLAAILGTIGGLGIAGLVALVMGQAAHLTGFGSEEAVMLLYIPQDVNLDIRGLLFAGIIIGALGAIMDVSMSVASAIEEVKRVNPALQTPGLFKSGMNVGRDIMGTMSNTLILAYTGSSVPLLLIFLAYRESLVKMINLDMIASEVVRALSGSVAMILVVPLTAAIAALLFGGVYHESESNRSHWTG